MEILIFGPDKPEIGFWFNPAGELGPDLKIHSKNNFVLNFEGRAETITWGDLMRCTTPHIVGTDAHAFIDIEYYEFLATRKNWHVAWARLKDRLLQMPQTKGEKAFLSAYLDLCGKRSGDHEARPAWEIIEGSPALIPQVWVNWIPYDPKDKERARKTREQPFRVDFVMFHKNRRFVIEIDGKSHFSEILDIDPTSDVIHFEPSMERYTAHLKKDRRLRSWGWDLWRFSDDEVLGDEENVRCILDEMGCRDLLS